MRFYSQEGLERIRRAAALRGAPALRGDEYIAKLDLLRQQTLTGKLKVIIIGAGISGLSAAYELEKLGCEVIILEAQTDHIGGRVRTHREVDGLYAEFGAMRIPKTHTLTGKYISELGLETRPFVQRNPKAFCYVRNHVFNRSDAGIEQSKALFCLRDNEKDKKYDEFWLSTVVSILDKFTDEEKKDLFSTIPSLDKIKGLDRTSLLEIFRNANVSDEATELVITHFGLETYLQTSLAEHLREEQELVWMEDGFSEIVDGTDMLAKKFCERLKNEIVLGAEVFKIEQCKEGAIVNYRKAGNLLKVFCDWTICTAPLGVVSTMEIEGFSYQKWRAIRRVNYDSSTKVVARVHRRFWEQDDGIFGGGSIYDSSLGHTWYPSDNAQLQNTEISAKPSMLLASYTWGQAARRIDAIPESELQAFITEELQKIHTNLKSSDIEKVIRWSWTENPWSRGAFAFFNPGEHELLYSHLKEPEGRVILAGEHCSLSHSWIQGALESAIDASHHIIKKF